MIASDQRWQQVTSHNDGYDDVAIGIPGEDIGSRRDAGQIMVAYGSSAGLSSRKPSIKVAKEQEEN